MRIATMERRRRKTKIHVNKADRQLLKDTVMKINSNLIKIFKT